MFALGCSISSAGGQELTLGVEDMQWVRRYMSNKTVHILTEWTAVYLLLYFILILLFFLKEVFHHWKDCK